MKSACVSILTLVFVLTCRFAGAEEQCAGEALSFEAARGVQIEVARLCDALGRRIRGTESDIASLRQTYARRRLNLRRQRALLIADAAAASLACALFDATACQRFSSLSYRISRVETELRLLPAREKAALAIKRATLARYKASLREAREALMQANTTYITTLLALRQCAE